MPEHRGVERRRSSLGTMGVVGLLSVAWLALRSSGRPDRLRYPCQQVALANAIAALGAFASALGLAGLHRLLSHRLSPRRAALLVLAVALALLSAGGQKLTPPAFAAISTLPAWTSPTAKSSVYSVLNVPTPTCSLANGALPASGPCATPSYGLRDVGVESLFAEMDRRGEPLHRTAAQPNGTVAATDIVVIKVNNQFGGQGSGAAPGRLSTNSDVLKGVIWRVLQHPDGFTGEIVVAENTQGMHPYLSDDGLLNNAEDRAQSMQDVVDAFAALGYPVSTQQWDDLNGTRYSGGTIGSSSFPPGEYATGQAADGYVLLDDPASEGTNQYSYPKFRTARGNLVSMRYGVWNGTSYDTDRLTWINLPVLKCHCMAGSTIAWKNLIGFVTISANSSRFGGWDEMHDYFWGYTGGSNPSYGLIGRQMALIRTPDLNVVDGIWVSDTSNWEGSAVRQNVLLASRDPFAVDWYASEHIVRTTATYDSSARSAARSGTFRSATRTNQDAAAAVWPGSYPYIDLLPDDPAAPLAAEQSQMSSYVVTASVSTPSLSIGDATVSENGTATFVVTLTDSPVPASPAAE